MRYSLCFFSIIWAATFIFFNIAIPAEWEFESVDTRECEGSVDSAINSKGELFASYWTTIDTKIKLMLVKNDSFYDWDWHIDTVTYRTDKGPQSITVDEDGRARIVATFRKGATDYQLLHFRSHTIDTIMDGSTFVHDNSIDLDSNGNSHISYRVLTSANLKYICSSNWVSEDIDTNDYSGRENILRVASDNKPHVLYSRGNNLYLKRRDGVNTWTQYSSFTGQNGSFVLSNMNRPYISYCKNGNLWIRYFDGSWNDIEIDNTAGETDSLNSIYLDSNNYPHIAYIYRKTGETDYYLRYIWQDASGWHKENVDSTHTVTGAPSITVNEQGDVNIMYLSEDEGHFVLKHAFRPKTSEYKSITVNSLSAGHTVWAADTVKVAADLTIGNGDRLTINPGTYVEFQGHYKLDVAGRLTAVGTASDSIIFTIKDTTGFVGATTAGSWAGIRFDATASTNQSSQISYCQIKYGKATASDPTNSGGAIYIKDFSKLLISHCTIHNNRTEGAGGSGGAIYCSNANPTIKYTIINDNSSSEYGGGIYCTNSNPIITNNTIINNIANSGGGFFCTSSSSPALKNSILWGNNGEVYIDDDASNPTFSYCNIQGNYSGFAGTGSGVNYDHASLYTNNIDADPQFAADNSIQSGSPCIDSGNPDDTPPSGGEPRIDMGAIEFIPSGQQTGNNLDTTLDGNIVNGTSCAVAAEFGQVNATVTQYLSYPPSAPAGKPHIGRYWDISATNNAYIRLYYPADATNSFSNPTIFHYTTSWHAIPTSAEQTDGTSRYVESTAPLTSWSNFTVGDGDDPLPIELANFYAEIVPNGIKLHWKTVSEINNAGFYVYRDGVRISDLISGHGTTNEPHEYNYLDFTVKPDIMYTYRISDVEQHTEAETFHHKISVIATSDILQPGNMPTKFALHTNYPNPFNPNTHIKFDLAKTCNMSLIVYDIAGRLVKVLVNDEEKEAGYYSIEWNGTNENGEKVASGIYFYKMTTEAFQTTKRMALVK
jgi:hypothetical protein